MKRTLVALALASAFSCTAVCAANLTTPITWDSLAADAKDHTKWDASNLDDTNSLKDPSVSGDHILNTVTSFDGAMFLGAVPSTTTSYQYAIYGIYTNGEDFTLGENAVLYVVGHEDALSDTVGLANVWNQKLSVTNKGSVWVDGAGSEQRTIGLGVNPGGTIANEGSIHVKGGAYGMIAWNQPDDAVTIENSGEIVVEDAGSTGILANGTVNEDVGKYNVIRNTGKITAVDGATAISALGQGTDVRLEGNSSVEGAVKLGEQTNLTIALAADNENTQLELVGERIGTLTLTDSDVEFTGDQQAYSFEQINSTGSSELRLVGNDRTMQADAVNGTLSIYSDHAGDGTVPVVDVKGVGATDSLSVTFGGNIADTVGSASEVESFFEQNVSVEGDEAGTQGAYSGKIEETVTTGEITYNVDADGNTSTTFTTSTVADSTKELAALNAMAWRTELSTLTDRMGALRTRPSDVGVWARYTGGKLSKDDAWGELKMNTVELGFDMPIGQSPWIFGASFSYGDGDGDFEAGKTDNKKYTLGLYATYMNDSGCFLDIMAKVGQVQSDFDFATTTGVLDSGDVDQMGYIFGVEAGHRFSGDVLFVEPQIGLVYSYLDGDSTTTSNRALDLDSVESLIGRVGFMFGGNFAQERASVYGRAFLAHDFQGDVEGKARALSAGSQWRSFSQELAGTWGEFGIGGTYRMTDSSLLAIDVSKTVGGDIDTDYRFNVLAKYMF